jgi:uncharacterized repeat protein (TIGR02543 family)
VTLDAYYIGKYEVTKAEWDEVRTWGLSNGYTDLAAGSGKASNHPVQTITWYDMVKWCNARSQKEGLTPAYYTNDAQTTIYKTGDVDVTNAQVNWSANGYRLPTEAEWEKAARGGLSGKRFPWGDTISHSQANYQASSNFSYDFSGSVNNYHPTYATEPSPYTSPVGAFAANGYGLHDMAGNVWEWCWDWYGTYAAGSQTNPRGSTSGTTRVGRGGGWHYGPLICRVAWRYGFESIPTYSNMDFGFRVARSAVDADSDSDGLVDSVETNTDVFVSESNTGTNPNNADTDADGVPDGLEVKEKTSPVDATKFNSFSKGMVAYYRFNENFNDESGFQNDLSNMTSGVQISGDRFGNMVGSVKLTSNEDYAFSVKKSGISGNQNHSISLWVYFAEAPVWDGRYEGSLVRLGSAVGVVEGSEIGRESRIMVDNYNEPGQSRLLAHGGYSDLEKKGLGDIFLGQWRHIVFSYNGQISTSSLYLDGVKLDASLWMGLNNIRNIVDGPVYLGSTPLVDGRASGSVCQLSDIRIYNRALSAEEVASLYTAESTPKSSFQIIEGSFTWHEAKADAEARGGRLAVLDTQEKVDQINEYIHSLGTWPEVWLGLTDESSEGDWKWITGQTLANASWAPTEPNGSGNYGLIYGSGHAVSGLWDDQPESWPKAYLIEYSTPDISLDADGDGYADEEELQWGTDPNNSASYPQVYLSFSSNGGGYVGVSYNDYYYDSYYGSSGIYVPLRSTVTLTAFADYDYSFSGWGGDVYGSSSTVDLYMDGNKSVQANFQYNGGGGYWPPYDYDSDGDGIYDDNEYSYGTDPYDYDTDNDGLGDGAEVYTYYTNPLLVDSDGDGLTDGNEVYQHATNPLLVDTDADGYSDGNEVQSGSNPNDPGSVPNPNSGPLFTDIATESPSLAKHSITAVMDYDRDGKEDLLVQSDSGTRLLKQAGSFQFDDVTSASGLDGLQNALVADFTNDGLEDVLDIASDKSYASIRVNNGEGYYAKTDLNQVLEGDLASYRDLMTGDIDNDGDIDLIYAVNPPFGGGAVAYLPNITERGAQNVQFGQKSYLVRTSWQFAKFDLTDANNDGLTDLVILQTNGSWPYDTHPDHPAVLYLGTGRSQNDYLNPDGSSSYVGFVEKADCGINAANEMSRFTSWDIDNDGDLDLINGSSDWRSVSNPHIYINDGAGNYAQQDSPVYHSGQYYHHGITIFDADADNDLDAVWTGLHNFSNIYPRMWKNEGGLAFSDATAEWGITSQIPGSGNLGSSGYAADLDDDGDQDFVVQGGNGWGSESYYAVYRNNADQKGSKCLKIELEGASSHAKGFGARVEVRANGKTLTQWVSNHVGSIPTTRLHFGLGESHDVEFINVYWPSGLKSSLSNPDIVGNTLKITEPASEPTPRFQIVEGSYTWHEAKADAEARGGRLAVLDTQEKIDEANAFLNEINHSTNCWIGLTDELSEGQWKWITGNDLSESNWNSGTGEPNNGYGYGENYAMMAAEWQWRWNDAQSVAGADISYILELPSPVLTTQPGAGGNINIARDFDSPTATLTAIPNHGYVFTGWTGDATGTTNPLSLTMDADKKVGAKFEPDYADNDSDGLTNYDECVNYYTNPNSSDTDGDGYSDGEEVERGSNPNYSDSYPQVYLSFSSVGGGHIDASGIDYYDYWYYGSYSGDVPLRSLVTLTAVPDSGYVFGGWVGGVADETNPLELQMDSDKSIQANFEPDHADNDGDGLTNYDEATVHYTDLNSSDTDGDGYSDGEEVERGSSPTDSWSKPQVYLSFSSNGGGRINATGIGSYDYWMGWYDYYYWDPYNGYVDLRSTVTLTATPATGYVFSGWIGDASGTNNPLTLLMNADKTVEATFVSDASDFDGDGLTNYQEIVEHNTNPNMADTNSDGLRDGLAAALGMNPNADHSLFVETILAERAQLGLRKDNDIIDMRPGSMLLQRAPGSDKLEIRMKMQKSSNMLNWQDDGEAVIEVPVDPTSPRQFYRFGVK